MLFAFRLGRRKNDPPERKINVPDFDPDNLLRPTAGSPDKLEQAAEPGRDFSRIFWNVSGEMITHGASSRVPSLGWSSVLARSMGLNGLWPKALCRRHRKVGTAAGAVRHIELLLLNGNNHRSPKRVSAGRARVRWCALRRWSGAGCFEISTISTSSSWRAQDFIERHCV
jgi:hypothetical protein